MRERIQRQRSVRRVGHDFRCSVLHEVRQSLDSRQPREHVRAMSPTERDRSDHAPDFGADFWCTDQMRDAFASRDMGMIVRAYRYHPAHGHKALPQETVSRWIGTVTQSQLSRIESGRNRVDTLDKLIHYARAQDAGRAPVVRAARGRGGGSKAFR